MVSELTHQADIVRSVHQSGGMGWKIREITGMPDLLLLHPSWGVCFAECKFIREVRYAVDVRVSIAQREKLRRINSRGGWGLVLVVYHWEREYRLVVAGSEVETLTPQDNYIVRESNQFWPIVKRLQEEL
jgi:hypothetical protein